MTRALVQTGLGAVEARRSKRTFDLEQSTLALGRIASPNPVQPVGGIRDQRHAAPMRRNVANVGMWFPGQGFCVKRDRVALASTNAFSTHGTAAKEKQLAQHNSSGDGVSRGGRSSLGQLFIRNITPKFSFCVKGMNVVQTLHTIGASENKQPTTNHGHCSL